MYDVCVYEFCVCVCVCASYLVSERKAFVLCVVLCFLNVVENGVAKGKCWSIR